MEDMKVEDALKNPSSSFDVVGGKGYDNVL
jgi:hypothetical protein